MIYIFNVFHKSFKSGNAPIAVVAFDTITSDDNLLEGNTIVSGKEQGIVDRLNALIDRNSENLSLSGFPYYQMTEEIPDRKNWFWVSAIMYTFGYSSDNDYIVQNISGPSDETIRKFIPESKKGRVY